MVYEQIKDDIEPFLKLYRLAKAKGIGVRQVIDVLTIANNDLLSIEERFKRLRTDASILQSQKHTCKRNLYKLDNQIVTASRLLGSLRMSCERERRGIEHLQNEKAKLEAVVTGFKNNNEDYLEIKQAAEEKVKSVLTNSKLLLQFATFSVIESLRSNPELYNFVIHDNPNNTTTISYGPNYYPSLISSGRQQHQQQSFNDSYTALILEEAEKLYNRLTTELISSVIAAVAAIRASSLPSPHNNNND